MINKLFDNLPILFIDEFIIAIDKPSGLLSIQDGHHPEFPYVKEMLEKVYQRIWTIHRLDKYTSGVLVFARDANTHRALNIIFEKRLVIKQYIAVVYGILDKREFIIHEPLSKNGDHRHRTIINHVQGKPAKTIIRVLKKYSTVTLVQAKPQEGFTHQIRAHLAYIHHPIVGDNLYAFDRNSLPQKKDFQNVFTL